MEPIVLRFKDELEVFFGGGIRCEPITILACYSKGNVEERNQLKKLGETENPKE